MLSQKDRKNKLKFLLSKQIDYITAEEIAESMDVSAKTIYRLVKRINEEYSAGELISSEKGRGYKLNYEKYMEQDNPIKQSFEISPTKRQELVMEELLLSSPQALKILDLFAEFYIGDSAISNDERVIARRIQPYELKLVRKNRSLSVEGKEENIRRAIAELIPHFTIIDLDEIKSSEGVHFNHYDAFFVFDQLRMIEKKLGVIPYPYNVNIFSHLYIMIRRARKMNHQLSEERITNEQLPRVEDNPKIKEISSQVITNIEVYLTSGLPISEHYSLEQYLVSSRVGTAPDEKQRFTSQIEDITNYFLKEVGKKMKIDAISESIFIDLANHIKPMVNRLKNKIRVQNCLSEQIKLTYETIYLYVSEAAEKVSEAFLLPTINQDEIGFISLYFARIIETHQLPIQTLIMCTTGVGTSELLRTKVAKKFPKLTIVDVIATKDYSVALEKSPNIELILTTIRIYDTLPVRSLIVSAMLTADDQARIQQKIEEIYHEK